MPLTLAKLVKNGFGKAFLLGKRDFKRMYHFVLIGSHLLVCVCERERDVLLGYSIKWVSRQNASLYISKYFVFIKTC